MRQTVNIIYDKQTEYVVDRMYKNIAIDAKYFAPDLEVTDQILLEMANNCQGEYFYIIKTDKELLFTNFDFSYRPEIWDRDYMHIWNNDTSVRLLNTDEVKNNPSKFNDKTLKNGLIHLKNLYGKIYEDPVFDIIFLSYDEINADENFNKLKSRFLRVKRIENIKGIFEAHKAAAKLAFDNNSDMFYVIDADADVMPTFNFNFQPHSLDRQSVIVWHSLNPVNDLMYGYGGIKLFPTDLLMSYNGSPIDFTTTVSKNFKVIPEVSNITKFNVDPFSAWRSGFRECAKLASKIISNQDNTETEHRLSIWCNVGSDREFGDFTIMGAKEGAEFGKAHKDQPDELRLINNYDWLEKKFNS